VSYLALARKYRPQKFSELLSQDFVTKTLENALRMDRVSHAYLFTGPRGIGKTSAARIFAKAINCLNPDGVVPCNVCDNCQDISASRSLDVIEIDGASNRGVDEIRALREAVQFIPINSKFKIYIIDEVHMLTKEAFNALLKTLEEPPKFVIFIFATTESNKIAPTILSRCQRYDFKKIDSKMIYENIIKILGSENIEFEEDAIHLIVRRSDGCMRDTLSLLDQIIAFTNGSINLKDTSFLLNISDNYISQELFELILKEEPDKIAEITKRIQEQGIDYKYLTESLIEHTRNSLYLTISNLLPTEDLTSNEKEFYNKIKKHASHQRLYALFQIFTKLIQDIKYFDFHQYIFEFAMFKAATISQIIPIDEAKQYLPSTSTAKPAIAIEPTAKQPIEQPPTPAIDIPLVAKEKTTHEDKKKVLAEKVDIVSDYEHKDDSINIWAKICNLVQERLGEPISTNIKYGYLISADSIKIVVGFDQDRAFYYNYIKQKDVMDKIKSILDEIAKPAPILEFVLEDNQGKNRSIADILSSEAEYTSRKTKKKILEIPFINSLINNLDATVEEININIKSDQPTDDDVKD